MNIKVILDRIEDEKAVLITELGEEIIINKSLLPSNYKESKVYYISIKENPLEKNNTQAKEILNEILNPQLSE